MILNDIYEFDDILSDNECDYLEKYAHSINDWKYYDDINLGESDNKKYRPGYVSGNFNSKTKEIINKIIAKSLEKIKYLELKRHRIKINKTEPIQVSNKTAMSGLHIDGLSLGYTNHIVIIYYINSNDGDTLLSEYHIDNIPNIDEFVENIENENIDDYKIIKKIKPSKGKVIMFDGGMFHCGMWPTKIDKFIININLDVLEIKKIKTIM